MERQRLMARQCISMNWLNTYILIGEIFRMGIRRLQMLNSKVTSSTSRSSPTVKLVGGWFVRMYLLRWLVIQWREQCPWLYLLVAYRGVFGKINLLVSRVIPDGLRWSIQKPRKSSTASQPNILGWVKTV